MANTHIETWEKCLEVIRKQVPTQSFKTWFAPIKPIKLKDHVLTIQVPNKFFYEWLEENYIEVLGGAIRAEIGQKATLEYQILVENHKKVSRVDSSSEEEQSSSNMMNPFIIPGIKRIKIEPQLISKYRFTNYIEGECNKLARSVGLEIVKRPGVTSFNPFFIYGDTGLGKTHLAHAIGNEIMEKDPSKQVLYVNVERFTNQVIQALKQNTINDFLNFYQMVDVLIVDDIQFLAKKEKTQEVFFNIFNQLHQSGKQIILTSDRPPKDMQDFEKRLLSRFKWGLNADLGSPEFDTRMQILKQKMQEMGLALEKSYAEYICQNVKSNIRELEGILNLIEAHASLNRRKISLELVKEVVSKSVTQHTGEITVDVIKRMVAEHFEISMDKLQGNTRKRTVVIARQLSMYFAKTLTNSSLKLIGDSFGGKDHSTVIYSVKAVQDMMDTNALFRDTVIQLERKMQNAYNF